MATTDVRRAFVGCRCVAALSPEVGSEGAGEDGVDASAAGQMSTTLCVNGSEALHAAIVDCWRSADTERAREYRKLCVIMAVPYSIWMLGRAGSGQWAS